MMGEKELNVLFGFDDRKVENSVVSYLKLQGYNVRSIVKLTKQTIMDFLHDNPSYNCAVLLEVLNGAKNEDISRFTAEELASLTDTRDINVVVIVNEEHKGTEFMQYLYGANITSAIYQKGRKGGATPKDIAELLMNKRSRKDARLYYGISEHSLAIDFLGNDSFKELYNKLFDANYGERIIDRFLNICSMMNQDQLADYIRRLPAEIRGELEKYKEFQELCGMIRDGKIPLYVNKPKHVVSAKDTVTGTAAPEPKTAKQKKKRIKKETSVEQLYDEVPSDGFQSEPLEEQRTKKNVAIFVIMVIAAAVMFVAGLYVSGVLTLLR